MGNFHWGLAFRVGGGEPTMSRAGGGSSEMVISGTQGMLE